jgi:hypothetical protein
MFLLPFILFNGVGFNTAWMQSVSLQMHMDRHMDSVWQNVPEEKRRKDLESVWKKANKAKDKEEPRGYIN